MLVEIIKMNKEEVTAVSSLDVAETFGKRHADVMRDIRELGASEEFSLCNFAQSSYTNYRNLSNLHIPPSMLYFI